MHTPDLFLVCVTAFAAVFALLGLLALVMRGLMAGFPVPPPTTPSDPAMIAAITAAAAAAYPGAAITKIEEAP